jgi:hypothetical protein
MDNKNKPIREEEVGTARDEPLEHLKHVEHPLKDPNTSILQEVEGGGAMRKIKLADMPLPLPTKNDYFHA